MDFTKRWVQHLRKKAQTSPKKIPSDDIESCPLCGEGLTNNFESFNTHVQANLTKHAAWGSQDAIKNAFEEIALKEEVRTQNSSVLELAPARLRPVIDDSEFAEPINELFDHPQTLPTPAATAQRRTRLYLTESRGSLKGNPFDTSISSKMDEKYDTEQPYDSPLKEGSPCQMMLRPETPPIDQDTLVNEVKGIYANLVTVEKQCIQTDHEQSSNRHAVNSETEVFQLLVLLYRLYCRYLDENKDSSFEDQCTSVNQTLERLSERFAVPYQARRKNIWTILNLFQMSEDDVFDLAWLELSRAMASSLRVHGKCKDGWDKLEANAESEIERILELIREIFDRLVQRVYQLFGEIGYIITILELTCEFPGNMRYLCTTMPWTVWPALAVLWGVCWMFYSSPIMTGVDEASSTRLHPDPSSTSTANEIQLWSSIPEVATWPVLPTFIEENISGMNSASYWQNELLGHDDFEATYGNTSILSAHISVGDEADQPRKDIDGPPILQDLSQNHHNDYGSSTPIQTSQICLSLLSNIEEDDHVEDISNQHDNADQPEISSATPRNDVHEGNRKFTCTECSNKEFGTLRSLQRHRRHQHSGTGSLFCSSRDCKASKRGFKRRDQLLRHARTCKHQCANSGPQMSVIPSLAAPKRKDRVETNVRQQMRERRGMDNLPRVQNLIKDMECVSSTGQATLDIEEKRCQGERERLNQINSWTRMLRSPDKVNRTVKEMEQILSTRRVALETEEKKGRCEKERLNRFEGWIQSLKKTNNDIDTIEEMEEQLSLDTVALDAKEEECLREAEYLGQITAWIESLKK